jgi:hypothetical protein
LVVLGFAVSAEAGTWRVGRQRSDCPEDCHFFDSQIGRGDGILQAMVNAGVIAGDTVMVWPGSLPGGYQIGFRMKSGVVLTSRAGPDSTVICGAANFDPAVSFVDCSPSTVIQGFTIKWNSTATGLGGAIGCYGSSGMVRNNVIRECLAGSGAGVYQAESDVLVADKLFRDNESSVGGGVVALSSGSPTVRNNTFYGCVAPFGTEGAAVFASGSAFTFDRNVVVSSRGAPALFCDGTSTPTVTCNLFWDNELGPYAGGCVDSTGISGNIAADPLFCNPTPTLLPPCEQIEGRTDLNPLDFSFGVCVDSPARTGPCGVIGYSSPLGDCAACKPTSLLAASWGRIKARYRP